MEVNPDLKRKWELEEKIKTMKADWKAVKEIAISKYDSREESKKAIDRVVKIASKYIEKA